MKRSVFMVLLGPVGVGKSTLSNTLIRTLSTLGFSCRKVLVKAFHGLSNIMWKLISKIIIGSSVHAPWYDIPMHGYRDLAKVLIIVSAYLDALINIPLKLGIIRLLKLLGFTILSEEYLYTTILDYLYSYIDLSIKLTGYTIFPLEILYSLALRYRPDIVIVLDASMGKLLYRWKCRGYGDPQLKYVKVQRMFLRRIFEKRYFKVSTLAIIDTSNMDVRDITFRVLEILLKSLRR